MQRCFICAAFASQEQPDLVTRTETFVVLLDTFPLAEGHVLIAPRSHIADFFDLPRDEYLSIMVCAAEVSCALKKVTGRDKIGAFFAGKATGDHSHLHLLPLQEGLKHVFEGLSSNPRPAWKEEALEAIAADIRAALPVDLARRCQS